MFITLDLKRNSYSIPEQKLTVVASISRLYELFVFPCFLGIPLRGKCTLIAFSSFDFFSK